MERRVAPSCCALKHLQCNTVIFRCETDPNLELACYVQLALVEAQRASETDSRQRAEEVAAAAERRAAEETARRERAEQQAAAAQGMRGQTRPGAGGRTP